MYKISLISTILILLCSCSVSTAMKGQEITDLRYVTVGATYSQVNKSLGRPIRTVIVENGERVNIYKYNKLREPSFLKVIGNIVMDVVTIGYWESLGPLDSSTDRLYITYDDNERVSSINKYILARNF